MRNQPPSVLDKLAAYEAAKLSTQPLYDEWSQCYEQDLVGNLGYTGHLIAANALAEFAPDTAASIIDIGCGTGLVGQALKPLATATSTGSISLKKCSMSHALKPFTESWCRAI